MTDIKIELELQEGRGRYVAHGEGATGEAELVFARPGKDRLVANHTYTPPELRGRGIAAALVERMVADARRDGFKIVPRCSYVRAQFASHPEWSDVAGI